MNQNAESRPLGTGGLESKAAGSDEFTGSYSSGQPACWSPQWKHFPLKRKSAADPRMPLLSMSACPAFWEGFRQPWEEWLDDVENRDVDVAFLPWANNVVILDCDVKEYAGGFVLDKDNPRTATIAPRVVKYGIDDLARTVEEYGHTTDELETYTVRTKSGGLHLYFDRGNFRVTTRHHREDWRIDVIATPHNWVAAPPTPGYTVVNDVPMIPLPAWLYEIVANINDLKRPVGGKKRSEMDERIKQMRASVEPVDCDKGLLKSWISTQYELIELANEHGAWNSTIFQVACDFFALGYAQSIVEKIILPAAKPWDARQERNVLATIESARSYKMRSRS